LALVAVTTATLLGVATPWMVSGGGGVEETGMLFELPPHPEIAALNTNAHTPTSGKRFETFMRYP